jgi:hypothetical protein
MAALLVLASLGMSAALVAAQDFSVDRDCTVAVQRAYTSAYMSTLNGECSLRDCTPGCQQKIDAVRSACVDAKFNETDPLTGKIATRSFMQKSIQSLQLTGPYPGGGPDDCDYHSPGAPRCDESLCTLERVAEVTGRDCLGVNSPMYEQPFAAWRRPYTGVCRSRFENVVRGCGGCDARDRGAMFLGSAATALGRSQSACDDVTSRLDSVCCRGSTAGPHGCDIAAGRMPAAPNENIACQALTLSAALSCPDQFTSDPKMLGLFLDSGGSLQQLFAAAPVPTVTPVYCNLTRGHGVAMPGTYGRPDNSAGRRLEETTATRARQALQEPGTALGAVDGITAACSLSYQAALSATVSGDCSTADSDGDRTHCTFACQTIITEMLRSCEGQSFEQVVVDHGVTSTITRMFTERAVQALTLLGGPADCAYHQGYQQCRDQCTIVDINLGMNGGERGINRTTAMGPECVYLFMGVGFRKWDGCGTPSTDPPGWDPASQEDKAICLNRYWNYVEGCSGCSDPFVHDFLKKAAKGIAQPSAHCVTCDEPQAIADTIEQLCCVGPGNAGDSTCSPQREERTDAATGVTYTVVWQRPDTIDDDGPCNSYITEIAQTCPSLFSNSGWIPGILPIAGTCEAPQPPAHASAGTCDASERMPSGTGCEFTCETGWCVAGEQPRCEEGGQLINTMRCEQQSVASCTFPPNGGCDPLTTCSDTETLFGKKLVKCSECPRGFYGSGRSGCYKIDVCTRIFHYGGCDHRTTCTNTDFGYSCSACPAPLIGDPYYENGCHLPPPEGEQPAAAVKTSEDGGDVQPSVSLWLLQVQGRRLYAIEVILVGILVAVCCTCMFYCIQQKSKALGSRPRATAYIASLIICIFVGPLCMWIPFVIDSCYEPRQQQQQVVIVQQQMPGQVIMAQPPAYRNGDQLCHLIQDGFKFTQAGFSKQRMQARAIADDQLCGSAQCNRAAATDEIPNQLRTIVGVADNKLETLTTVVVTKKLEVV